MKISLRNFPHPVLRHSTDDYRQSTFDVELFVEPKGDDYIVQGNFVLNCIELESLIKEHKASYVIHLECKATRYRNVRKTRDSTLKWPIPCSLLNERVEVCVLMTADDDVVGYCSKDFHEDFQGIAFDIMRGSILAVGYQGSFDADQEMDTLITPSSIFSVVQNKREDPFPIEVDLNTEKIQILLSPDNFTKYRLLYNDSQWKHVLASILVFPILVHVLEKIAADSGELLSFEDNRWYRSLQKKLKEDGLERSLDDGFSAVSLANQIIGDVVSSSLIDIENFGIASD